MKYLLDSNAVIALRQGHRVLIKHLRRQNADDVLVSCIVAYELYYGAFKSRDKEMNLQWLDKLQFGALDFCDVDARAAGQIRADLARRGSLIGPYDLLIAGQALARSMTLVTHNVKEFSRVEGLSVEDWLS